MSFDTHYRNWRDFPEHLWRWDNFSLEEIACKDGSIMVNEISMDKLQRLREALGKPILVTSAYRSPAYNRRIGGAKRSQHLLARAFDCIMTNQDPQAFEAAARSCGFTGFGFYPHRGFMHIDTGPARQWGKRFAKRDDNAFIAPDAPPPEKDMQASGELDGGSAGVALGAGVAVAASGLVGSHAIPIGLGVLVALCGAAFLFRRQIAKLFKKDDEDI